MEILEQQLRFIKSQADYQMSRADHYEDTDLFRAEAYRERHKKFLELYHYLESQKTKTTASSTNITPEDLIGLPQELIDALSISDSDKKDFAIIDALKSVGGVASIDKLMIGIYKTSGEIYDRNKLMARLYRMTQKELLYSHPSKKGVYSVEPIAADQSAATHYEEANDDL